MIVDLTRAELFVLRHAIRREVQGAWRDGVEHPSADVRSLDGKLAVAWHEALSMTSRQPLADIRANRW